MRSVGLVRMGRNRNLRHFPHQVLAVKAPSKGALILSLAPRLPQHLGAMIGNGLRRSLGLTARRLAAPQVAPAFRNPVLTQAWATGRPIARPLSALTTTAWQRVAARHAAAVPASKVAVAETASQAMPQSIATTVASTPKVIAETSADAVRQSGMIFEIGITFTVAHYVHIFQSLARGLFQSFRPLLILYVFSHILKAVFFILGAPMWFSFYSIWMFEVGYGLFQCLLSLIFIGTFYGNLLCPRVRPTMSMMSAMIRQQRDKLSRVVLGSA